MKPDSETTPASIARQPPRHGGFDAHNGNGGRQSNDPGKGTAPGNGSGESPSETVMARGRLTPVELPAAALYQWMALGVMELDCHGVMVDGASAANPYALVMAAKARGLSADEVTRRVHVVRGFTAHQLERLCTHDLPELALELAGRSSDPGGPARAAVGAQWQRLGLIWLSGLGLFTGDDQLQPLEGEALRGRSLKAMQELVTRNWAFGIVTAAAGRGYGHTGPGGPGTAYRIEFTQEECRVGRSLPSYRNQLEHTLGRWQAYRRALSPRERPFFDRVEAMVRAHAAQGAYLGSVDPIEPVLLAVLVEQEKRLEALEGRRTLESHSAPRTDDGAMAEAPREGAGASPVRDRATTGERALGNQT